MKRWEQDHPKARLMARKRAAILDAARDNFLHLGYEGSSMEAIAAGAGVSIMTLYRHAESKHELFAAVIESACDPDDPTELARFAELLQKPLGDIVLAVGLMVQERLADRDTVALLRVVMAEAGRFPELAERAYAGLIGHFEARTVELLAMRPETAHIAESERAPLAAAFVERLIGQDLLRSLLGLPGGAPADRLRRAESARDLLLGRRAAFAG